MKLVEHVVIYLVVNLLPTYIQRKNSVYLIVPQVEDETEFVAYLATAFALKFIQVIHIIFVQVYTFIFILQVQCIHIGAIALIVRVVIKEKCNNLFTLNRRL